MAGVCSLPLVDDVCSGAGGIVADGAKSAVNAIAQSADAGGKVVEIEPVGKTLRPGADQVIHMHPKQEDQLVDAKPPEEG